MTRKLRASDLELSSPTPNAHLVHFEIDEGRVLRGWQGGDRDASKALRGNQEAL